MSTEKQIRVMHISLDNDIDQLKVDIIDVDDKLEEYQRLVGGHIEVFPLSNKIILVCNEEGKLKDLPLLVVAKSVTGNTNYIAGNFFVCVRDEEDFGSISDEEIVQVLSQLIPLH